jgi:hypothetical protein
MTAAKDNEEGKNNQLKVYYKQDEKICKIPKQWQKRE